ncbi:ABC transporter permease [Phyllobacterium endophyticum]|uniref:ABC transporter permease n=1 Tax=Phyllobacterium endophyticum TaxID=1149773 RepID=A0A2P7AKD3_9HYPH|nr:ABC transporter permease [Phyllobacterium endophyticum]MBB3237095.1 ABC-type spermidine/putrescine transport system permease subunit I [Phyllobacterium endophyticum]PSH54669.1 ABC transporter permease [Phyllobacterium endophyticum]TYR40564.1 ABC transporter permease [Phyllobacterium endophyticum]
MATVSHTQTYRRKSWGAVFFILPLLILVVIGFDIPIVTIFNYSISSADGYSLDNFYELVTTPVFAKVALNTLRITVMTTVIVAIAGYILAYWISTLPKTGRMIALALVVLPFWISVLVRTYAWIVVLGNAGIVNKTLQSLGLTAAPISFLYNDLGVTIGMANIQLPLLVLPLYAALIRVDQRHMQAAASLGASKRVIFWRVFFPQTLKAYLAGIMLVTIVSIGFYITPAILGGGRVPMMSNVIETYINTVPRWELASAIAVILLFVTLGLFAIYRRLENRTGDEL